MLYLEGKQRQEDKKYLKSTPNLKNLALLEHEVMGPKLTQAEGFILGVGARMFTIAGPVIVYGVSASVVYGFIYWITTLF